WSVMLTKSLRLIAISALFGLALAATAAAQDFQKTYQIGAGGSIHVSNVSGDGTVTGYDGSAIIVTGTKQGPDQEMLTVEDRSSGNNVHIGVHYPQNCNCNASIQFTVQVPRSINYNFDHISSVSGNVNISGVTGRIHATAVSGNVVIQNVVGSVTG